ncbi:hypothetical protein CsSME_00053238 [Camellia sinensis var. sinensis]
MFFVWCRSILSSLYISSVDLTMVHGPGADMDTLCVGPSYVNREEDFFIILHDMLAEMEEITELQPVPDAYVPVMKFKYQGRPLFLVAWLLTILSAIFSHFEAFPSHLLSSFSLFQSLL